MIEGDAGKDTLTGGKGDDTFVYNRVDDSMTNNDVISKATLDYGDTITDFEIGKYVIDLSGIDAIAGGGDDAFTFISGGFNNVAGELRYKKKDALVEADVDGDGLADFAILIENDPGKLTASDFVL